MYLFQNYSRDNVSKTADHRKLKFVIKIFIMICFFLSQKSKKKKEEKNKHNPLR